MSEKRSDRSTPAGESCVCKVATAVILVVHLLTTILQHYWTRS